MDAVVYTERSGEHLYEALGFLGCPAMLHLAIFAKLRLQKVVLAVHTHCLESKRTELEDCRAVDIAL